MTESKQSYKHGKSTLLALGTGTAVASVCILGLIMIRKTAPGLWSLGAIALAFVICRLLAGAFGHLVHTVPSGAGMFAFVARAWGPPAGMLVIAPYLILMILLGALESLIVGHLLSPWLPLTAAQIACGFLVLSWLICIIGVRLGFRIQALATWLLVIGMIAGGVWIMTHAPSSADLASRLLVAPPSAVSFASAVGQAVFLFMGFELVCAHIESSSSENISWALKNCVLLLALLYGFVLLALSMVNPADGAAQGVAALLPQVDLVGSAHSNLALAVAIALCLLASLTSLNGAYMGLSRLIAVMGSQRVLPRAVAAIHAPSLTPRRALTLLLSASLVSVVAIDYFSIYQAVIFAAAISATTLYALALLVRQRPPFLDPSRSAWAKMAERLLAVLLMALGAGVLMDAGDSFAAVLTLLIITYGAGLLASLRLRYQTRGYSAPYANTSLSENKAL